VSSAKRVVLSLRRVEMYADLLLDEVGMRLADVMISPRNTSSGSLARAFPAAAQRARSAAQAARRARDGRTERTMGVESLP
jgi:hypothetical protein